MNSHKPHILILPKWYPNITDPQLGIFIENHANLIAKEFKVSVIYVASDANIKERFSIKKTKIGLVDEIRITYKKVTFFKKLRHFLKYRKAQKIGLAQIKNTPDLVHVHVPIRPSLLAMNLQKKYGIPYLITEHWSGHLNEQFIKLPKLYQSFYKKTLSKASLVTAVSEPLAEKLRLLTKSEVQTIPNFILEPKNVHTKRDKLNRIRIISVSDLNNTTKNIIGLLRGFKKALEHNKRLHLSIIGDGPDKDKIECVAKELKLLDDVSFLGRKTQVEVQDILHDFDFYICNSNVETFGMTVAEALIAGKPVICTRCGGPESFVDTSNGILIETNDIEALCQAILDMSESFQDYNQSNISNEIKNKFGSKTVLKHWSKAYQSILDE